MESYNLLCKNYTYKDLTIMHFTALNEAQKEDVRQWRNHSSIIKFMYQQNQTSPQKHETFINLLRNANDKGYWAVFESKRNLGLGVISLSRINLFHSYAFLGIYVAPNQHHKGVGTKLLEALEYISFSVLKLHSLRLEVLEENTKAIDFYKRNNFIQEGFLKDFAFIQGAFRNIILMGKINEK